MSLITITLKLKNHLVVMLNVKYFDIDDVKICQKAFKTEIDVLQSLNCMVFLYSEFCLFFDR